MNDDTNRDRQNPSDGNSEPGNGFHPSVELLSEYLDDAGTLNASERDAVEGHLAGCHECQAVLGDLQMMVQTLQALPERAAPRSFALTPGMLEPATTPERPAPVVLQESAQWHARHAPKIRWATAVAAVLFVFVISADLVTNGLSRPTGTSNDDAPTDAITMMREAEDSDASGESGASIAEDSAAQPTPAAAEQAEEESADQPESGYVPPEEEQPESEEAPQPESEEAPASDDGEAAITDDEPADDEAGGEELSTMSVETTEEHFNEPQVETLAAEDSSQMRWRIVEVSLALVLALLLAVMIGLPKQRGARRR